MLQQHAARPELVEGSLSLSKGGETPHCTPRGYTGLMRTVILGALLLGLACSPPPPAPSPTAQPSPSPQAPAGREADRAGIQRLEQEARSLANPAGCAESGQCRAMPVGAKACGGPRYYLPYCPLTTDAAALQRKLEEVRNAEQQFNQKYGVISDCSFVSEPALTSAGGACQAR